MFVVDRGEPSHTTRTAKPGDGDVRPERVGRRAKPRYARRAAGGDVCGERGDATVDVDDLGCHEAGPGVRRASDQATEPGLQRWAVQARLEQLPDKYVGQWLNYSPSELYKVDEADKQDVEIRFRMAG